jgi:Holliday junction resolvasome RuvABC DNA-binding subunit
MSKKVTELEYERLKMSIEAYGIKVEVSKVESENTSNYEDIAELLICSLNGIGYGRNQIKSIVEQVEKRL